MNLLATKLFVFFLSSSVFSMFRLSHQQHFTYLTKLLQSNWSRPAVYCCILSLAEVKTRADHRFSNSNLWLWWRLTFSSGARLCFTGIICAALYSHCAAYSLQLDSTMEWARCGNESFSEVERIYLMTMAVWPSILIHTTMNSDNDWHYWTVANTIKMWTTVLDL